jgi:hypothetical protein
MTLWTVQCGYAAYYANTATVEAETLDQALAKAIETANGDPNWRSLDECGATFVDAVAEGVDADPWQDFGSAIPVPDRFAERGAPLVTVTIEGGVVQNVAIENGPARVVVRDYDTEGSDPTTLHTDANGDRYVRAEWSHPLPPQGG